jgi:hypothetical protein
MLSIRGRKMVEELQEFVASEEKLCKECVEEAQANEKLLIDLQFGISTLYNKLSEVKLKPVSTLSLTQTSVCHMKHGL